MFLTILALVAVLHGQMALGTFVDTEAWSASATFISWRGCEQTTVFLLFRWEEQDGQTTGFAHAELRIDDTCRHVQLHNAQGDSESFYAHVGEQIRNAKLEAAEIPMHDQVEGLDYTLSANAAWEGTPNYSSVVTYYPGSDENQTLRFTFDQRQATASASIETDLSFLKLPPLTSNQGVIQYEETVLLVGTGK